MGMSSEEIMEPGKAQKKNSGPQPSLLLATDQLGISQTRLSRILNLTQPAISQAVSRGREMVNLNHIRSRMTELINLMYIRYTAVSRKTRVKGS